MFNPPTLRLERHLDTAGAGLWHLENALPSVKTASLLKRRAIPGGDVRPKVRHHPRRMFARILRGSANSLRNPGMSGLPSARACRRMLENGWRARGADSQKNNSGSLLKLMCCACAAAGTKTERLPPGVCVWGWRGRVTDGW